MQTKTTEPEAEYSPEIAIKAHGVFEGILEQVREKHAQNENTACAMFCLVQDDSAANDSKTKTVKMAVKIGGRENDITEMLLKTMQKNALVREAVLRAAFEMIYE